MVLEKMIKKNSLSKSKSYVLNENKSIFDAIKKLQISKIKTLIVINKKKLIGTVTDGDIRRGILKGYNGSDEVLNVVNKKPFKKF